MTAVLPSFCLCFWQILAIFSSLLLSLRHIWRALRECNLYNQCIQLLVSKDLGCGKQYSKWMKARVGSDWSRFAELSNESSSSCRDSFPILVVYCWKASGILTITCYLAVSLYEDGTQTKKELWGGDRVRLMDDDWRVRKKSTIQRCIHWTISETKVLKSVGCLVIDKLSLGSPRWYTGSTKYL